MRSSGPNFTRFICRLHRRLLMLRLIECSAIGLAAASALSVLLLPLFLLREKSALPVVTLLLPLGALAGATWHLLRRPRILDTATEADRQLNLADLLATAWTIAGKGDSNTDPFEQAVLQMADTRAAALSPSAVLLNRLNARAWTGIGLTSALALALTLLSASPIISRAHSQNPTASTSNIASRTDQTIPSFNQGPAARARPIVEDHPGKQDENAFNPARRTTQTAGNTSNSADDARSTDPTGTGGGTGASRSPIADSLANATTSAPRNNTGSTPGSGGGAISGIAATRIGASSNSVNNSAERRNTPPWTTSDWPAARSAAENAVRSGTVPSQYHDLIRSYFTREE